jgi:seryl-tRNA synthetase
VINYSLIADALEYYQDQGYKLIDVPWTVPANVMKITCNEGHKFEDNKYLDKYLVGSAEQSFLYLIKSGQLPYGKYCAVTPCFRNDEEDELHQKYFMKVELIAYVKEWWKLPNRLGTMMADAQQFFSLHVPVDLVKTDDERSDESFDIEANRIELGSYGIRHHENISWVYGTGLAEPRLSIAMDKANGILGIQSGNS